MTLEMLSAVSASVYKNTRDDFDDVTDSGDKPYRMYAFRSCYARNLLLP